MSGSAHVCHYQVFYDSRKMYDLTFNRLLLLDARTETIEQFKHILKRKENSSIGKRKLQKNGIGLNIEKLKPPGVEEFQLGVSLCWFTAFSILFFVDSE